MIPFRIILPVLAVWTRLSSAVALKPRATTIPAPYVVPSSQEWDGDDGSWSTFLISVGTPGQDFRVLVATATGEVWVPLPDGCLPYPYDQTNCPSLRGVQPFGASQSPGFENNQSSTWELIGIYDVGTDSYLRNYTGVNAEYGNDTVQLGPASDNGAISADNQVVGGIAAKAFYMGMLGVGGQPSSFSTTAQPYNTLLTNLYDAGRIPSLSYGYTAGAQYREKGITGNLVLGGYDASRFTPSNLTFTFGSDASRPLQLGVQSIIASDSLVGVASLTPSGTTHFSYIDSTVPELWLPQEICDQFVNAFGLEYNALYDRYLVNTTMHNKLKSMNPTITIKLGNSPIDNGSSTNIELPYSAFDLQGQYPIFPNATYYFPIRNASNDTQYTLGRVLLQEAYLTVDHERGNFTLGQAIFSDPMPDSSLVTIYPKNFTSGDSNSSSSSSSSSGLSTGGIVGVAVAGAAAIILIAAAIFFFMRKKRKDAKAIELEVPSKQPAVEAGAGGAYVDQEALKPQELGSGTISELPSPGMDPNKWSKERYAEEQRQYLLAHQGHGHGGPGSPGLPGRPVEIGSDEGTRSSTHPSELPTPNVGQHHVYELPGEYYVPTSATASGSNTPNRTASPRAGTNSTQSWQPTPMTAQPPPERRR